jgi:hypothetical protein
MHSPIIRSTSTLAVASTTAIRKKVEGFIRELKLQLSPPK